MGDLIGNAVEGTLYHVAPAEFARVRALDVAPAKRAQLFATLCRLNVLYMVARAGSGHLGSSFSSLDIVSWLLLEELGADDLYFSSKGHDAPGLYAALIGMDRLDAELMHRFRRLGGLPGHPDVSIPGMVTNTGSLGMGIAKAKGMILANRLTKGSSGKVVVLLGDGELQEGQIWESLGGAANRKLHELTLIVDHNKLQSDTFVANVSDLGDLVAKFTAFGWQTHRIDGHDPQALAAALAAPCDGPKAIVADTVKGRGVSFMEHTAMESDAELYRFHSGAPSAGHYVQAAQELIDRTNVQLRELKAMELELEVVERPISAPPPATERLIPAYSEALLAAAARQKTLVALDADLVLDCGLIPFRDRHPERFVECGIAEMDMVSTAGGMALRGLLPVVHSFACFLATRANEQIYNNATERTKIVYMGALAGVVPGGPGHSHQSVRDISALAGMPGLTLMEPSSAAEVGPLMTWATETNEGSTYMRLVSIPVAVPYTLPDDYVPESGHGWTAREGMGFVVIGYGPVLLGEAWRALDLIREKTGEQGRLLALPWLNRVDPGWLREALAGCDTVFTLDNHYLEGGQGERVAAAILDLDLPDPPRIHRFGLDRIPACGANDEVLKAHGLDARSLADAMTQTLAKGG